MSGGENVPLGFERARRLFACHYRMSCQAAFVTLVGILVGELGIAAVLFIVLPTWLACVIVVAVSVVAGIFVPIPRSSAVWEWIYALLETGQKEVSLTLREAVTFPVLAINALMLGVSVLALLLYTWPIALGVYIGWRVTRRSS